MIVGEDGAVGREMERSREKQDKRKRARARAGPEKKRNKKKKRKEVNMVKGSGHSIRGSRAWEWVSRVEAVEKAIG